MSKRQLVVLEADPADPQYGAMFGLDPDRATGIPIPTFRHGPAVPAVGTLEGEAFYEDSTGVAYVWNGTNWLSIVPATLLTFPTDALLQADKFAKPGSYAVAVDTGNLYIMGTSGWRQANIQTWPTEAALLAATNIGDGTVAMALDTGAVFSRIAGKWRNIGPDHVANFAALAALPASYDRHRVFVDSVGIMFHRLSAAGAWEAEGVWTADEAAILANTNAPENLVAVASDTASTWRRTATGWVPLTPRSMPDLTAISAWTPPNGALAIDVSKGIIYARAQDAWYPKTQWVAKEASILAATWALDGQYAVASDTGHVFTRAGGQWIGTQITHYPTEVELLKAAPGDGVLAWADDTGKVFGRSQGVWRYLTDSVVPTDNGIGTIGLFSVATVPHSHLVCDGSTFDKALYPQLFGFLGSDTLPDLRDKFLRGWSAARPPMNAQPQATARPTNPFTTSEDGEHRHAFGLSYNSGANNYSYEDGSSRDGNLYTDNAGKHTHRITGGGDTETRPANIAIVYAIQALPLTANALVKSSPPIIGWAQGMWAKNSVVVHDGTIWYALEDIPSTDTAAPAAPKWATLIGGGVTIAATAPATQALGDIWYDTTAKKTKFYDGTAWILAGSSVTVNAAAPATATDGDMWLDTSFESATRGLNVRAGTDWISFAGWSLNTPGALLPAPGYLNVDPSDTRKPNGMVGLAVGYSTDGKALGLWGKRSGATYVPLTPPIGDPQHKRQIVGADDLGHPVWVDGCYKIADFSKKGSANHLLVENMHLYRKVEVEFIMIPRGGDVDFKVLMDDASGSAVTWNGATIGNYGSSGAKIPDNGLDKAHMAGGQSFVGVARCKQASLWRIKLTYLRQEAEWGILMTEAMGLHPNNHIIEYRGYGQIEQTTPLHKLTTNTSGNLNIDVHGTAYGYM